MVRRFAVVVEGKGDVSAISSLIAKASKEFGDTVHISEPPIRAGEAKKLNREGELERMLTLAASREDTCATLVLVDLDDGCAADFHASFRERAAAVEARSGKPIHICFCVREYETWFLADLETLREALPEYGWSAEQVSDPESIRGAKERLRRLARVKGYKQSRDQLVFTKKVDIKKLAIASRSFRKLIKALTGKSYDEISADCSG